MGHLVTIPVVWPEWDGAGIHFFPENTTTSTRATTAWPGMATIWTSW
jgi:hypothetical protein